MSAVSRPGLAGLRGDASLSAVLAGVVALIVSVASSIGLLVSAAQDFGLSATQTASWLTSSYLAIGVGTLVLSWRFRAPVLLAWTTPGLAVIAAVAATGQATFPEVLGASVLSAVVMIALGVTGAFEAVTSRIPPALAGALLAGVLLPFILGTFQAVPAAPVPVAGMILVFLAGRLLFPRWAVPAVLVAGALLSVLAGQVGSLSDGGPGALLLQTPSFDLAKMLALALPLTVLTLASQQLPGVAVLRQCGYAQVPVSPLITWTGVASLLSAPFGAHTTNLAAITAAIAAGKEAHPDPSRRWVACISAGALYLLLALGAGWVLGAVGAIPAPVIAALAGLSLVGTALSSLSTALNDESWREAAFLTLVVTASGVTFLGVGSAVWGLLAGGALAWAGRRRVR
ncbi:benzoate/H(+) symporter BenE family transporter [Deinococcus deserti]|uniref:Putative Benzoate membrane transport protein (Benzoate transporter) n=1 Tax=Deinococcus deserti (strain DSM 17065 / CIP 109153 / LMG 22923 / VCD115) TaxID=546414 RepID=C1CVX6_DEIDV|nr:benzoate/H(+) symporter BenE family transporter [Deinococcus deserti]ACO46343.1 putative Benzoate membrane transport protein (benzoate transporter) [Deinococcus deserti VCD115]